MSCASWFYHSYVNNLTYNKELNDLRKFICLWKSEVSVERILVERISVYKVIENMMEYLPCSTKFSMTLYWLPCFYTNDVIDLLP